MCSLGLRVRRGGNCGRALWSGCTTTRSETVSWLNAGAEYSARLTTECTGCELDGMRQDWTQ